MELKDNLKQLRKEKGITQQELADSIFVSRSAIAKWESGLGLPSADSMRALEAYFGVAPAQIATQNPEIVIIKKNQKIRKICSVTGWLIAGLLLSMLTVISLLLPFLIQSGNWGLTPESAAGIFSEYPYIDTGDCRIYYTVFEGELENGQHWISLSNFRPVRKQLWGWSVSEKDYESSIILHNLEMAGRLYSIKGKNGYYNLIQNVNSNNMRIDMLTLQEVKVNGKLYKVEKGFFFITPEPVEAFWLGEAFMRVE